MTVLKFDGDHSSLYLHVEQIRSYEESLKIITSNKRIYGSINKRFLNELNNYNNKHGRNYNFRKQIFLQKIYLFVPEGYNKSYLIGHLKKFCSETLEGLPVYAYLDKKEGIERINILICERYYLNKAKKFEVLEDHDIYKKRVEGKKGMIFCRKDDPDAVLCTHKGEIKYTFFARFSYKNRLFSGNSETFEFFVELMKNKWITLFKPLGIVTRQRYIKGISIKKSYSKKLRKNNIYWLRNIQIYNRIKCAINNDLTTIFLLLENFKISNSDPEYFDAFKLAEKYKMIFSINRNIYVRRCDHVEEFFNDIYRDWKNDFKTLIEQYQ